MISKLELSTSIHLYPPPPMLINFTVGTTPRPARPGERLLAEGHIQFRQSSPGHARPRSLDIFASTPIANVTLEIPVKENLEPSDVGMKLIDMGIPASSGDDHHIENLSFEDSARILTEAHGFPWVIKSESSTTHTNSRCTLMKVYSDGEWAKFRWGRRPPYHKILYFYDGGWFLYMLKDHNWDLVSFLCCGGFFLIPALCVLAPMLWWTRGFTWTQFWMVVMVWAFICGCCDIMRWEEEQEHPALTMWIVTKEEEGPLIGTGRLTIRHGSDRPPPYVGEVD